MDREEGLWTGPPLPVHNGELWTGSRGYEQEAWFMNRKRGLWTGSGGYGPLPGANGLGAGVLKRGIIGTGAGTLRLWDVLTRPNGAIAKMDSWLEADNYTNILHKGLERLVTKFQSLVRSQMQPDEFVSLFFNVANQLEDERRNFAISRLRVSKQFS
ncbi:hypothetical protein evm_014622 [Chilo suppressalis]|nr:hypothetical protein evm_014622 [Chilo suppressalis]